MLDEINVLNNQIKKIISKHTVFLCLGSDEFIFDSFGPIVGTMLKQQSIHCYGNLQYPVDKTNVGQVLNKIKDKNVVIIDVTLNPDEYEGFIVQKNYEFIFNDITLNLPAIFYNIRDVKLNQKEKNIRLYKIYKAADIITKNIVKMLE